MHLSTKNPWNSFKQSLWMVETIQRLQAYPDVTAPLGDFLSHFTHRKLFWNSSSWQQNYRKTSSDASQVSLVRQFFSFSVSWTILQTPLTVSRIAIRWISLCLCIQTPAQPQGCHSAGWEHQKATHTLLAIRVRSSMTWSQTQPPEKTCSAIQHLCVHIISLGLSF